MIKVTGPEFSPYAMSSPRGIANSMMPLYIEITWGLVKCML